MLSTSILFTLDFKLFKAAETILSISNLSTFVIKPASYFNKSGSGLFLLYDNIAFINPTIKRNIIASPI